MLTLASAFADRGHRVDLLLSRAAGPYLKQVPDSVNLIVLKAMPGLLHQVRTLSVERRPFGSLLTFLLLARTFRYLPDLVQYLQRQRPAMLFSAKTYPNLAALWARRLARVPTRVVVSERTNLSHEVNQHARGWQWHWRLLPLFVRRVYPWADAIVTVSHGVADDLALTTGLPRARITTIYNPVVSARLQEQAQAPLVHPWFMPGSPPVVLGAGRLEAQKDFPTLLKAFARVRAVREARLILLGEGKDRPLLEALAQDLRVAENVELPGFVENPFAYMARATVFVLSSTYEGLPGVLIQAMACGCPVVSTDCPSGPAEILAGGAYGPLAPVGDDRALAQAILAQLDAPVDRERLCARAALFSVEHAVERYLQASKPCEDAWGFSGQLQRNEL
jgi:glycosyltransferase involved in cell wall biosynthesis